VLKIKVIMEVAIISCSRMPINTFVLLPTSLLYNRLCLLCAKLVQTGTCALQIVVVHQLASTLHAQLSVLPL
jgi:hypothetical protein